MTKEPQFISTNYESRYYLLTVCCLRNVPNLYIPERAKHIRVTHGSPGMYLWGGFQGSESSANPLFAAGSSGKCVLELMPTKKLAHNGTAHTAQVTAISIATTASGNLWGFFVELGQQSDITHPLVRLDFFFGSWP